MIKFFKEEMIVVPMTNIINIVVCFYLCHLKWVKIENFNIFVHPNMKYELLAIIFVKYKDLVSFFLIFIILILCLFMRTSGRMVSGWDRLNFCQRLCLRTLFLSFFLFKSFKSFFNHLLS